MTLWLAQVFGIIGMFFNMASFQCRTKQKMMLVLGIGSSMFFLNFLLLGGYASAIFNIINIIRSVLIIKKNRHYNLFFWLLCAGYILASLAAYQNLFTLVLLFAQLLATFAMWYKNEQFIRKQQLFCSSPAWLLNNIFVSLSIGGIICEVFTIVSTVIALLRFRKTETEASVSA